MSGLRLKPTLYLICVLTDFASFIVVFAVSRGLAETQAAPWYLGVVGAGLALAAGVGSILGGWLPQRVDGRAVFITGAAAVWLSVAACWLGDCRKVWFLPGYWLMGIGLGLLYPPLISWLNQGEDAHTNRRGVSRTLISFCVAWNLGMMCGQLTAGELFSWGVHWTYGASFSVAVLNFGLVLAAARMVRPEIAPLAESTPERLESFALAAAFRRLSWIANLGGMFGGSMVIHLLPDLAVLIGVPADDHGKLLAGWRTVIILTYLVLHRAAFWHYRLAASLVSQLLAAAGLVVIARADSAGMLFAGLAMLGQLVGYNYFSGLYYSAAGSSHERRALAAGIHEATLAVGMATGTIIGGIVGTLADHRTPYLLAAAVMLTLMVAQGIAWRMWVHPLRRTCPGPVATATSDT